MKKYCLYCKPIHNIEIDKCNYCNSHEMTYIEIELQKQVRRMKFSRDEVKDIECGGYLQL